jgi:signal transduction histidine kinase
MDRDPKPLLNAAAESVDGQLKTAIQSAVHDFRSPLQTLFSSIDALDPQHLDPEGLQALQRIRRSTQALDAQVGELATLLRIQTGAFYPDPVSFEVGALLEELEEIAAPIVSDKGLRLEIEQPERPIFAFADAALIRQALVRMLRVLTKVTAQGEMRLSLDSLSPALPALTFRARSVVRGGLTGELARRLLLVQMIATSLGGQIEFYQEPGRRSCFVLTIPVQLEDPDAVPLPST